MTFNDIIKLENTPPENAIRLVRIGKFLHAHNQSAWLFYTRIADFKVMRKFVKTINADVYYLGFPESKFIERIGQRDFKPTSYGYEVYINKEEMPPLEEYDLWKEGIDADVSSRVDFNAMNACDPETEKEVLKKIREYQPDFHTMAECAMFLSEMRKILSKGMIYD